MHVTIDPRAHRETSQRQGIRGATRGAQEGDYCPRNCDTDAFLPDRGVKSELRIEFSAQREGRAASEDSSSQVRDRCAGTDDPAAGRIQVTDVAKTRTSTQQRNSCQKVMEDQAVSRGRQGTRGLSTPEASLPQSFCV